MNTTEFRVDVQPFTGQDYGDTFTVTVVADGLAQAERRALRRAVARAKEWNAEHPLAAVARRESEAAYRAVGATRADLAADVDDAARVAATFLLVGLSRVN